MEIAAEPIRAGEVTFSIEIMRLFWTDRIGFRADWDKQSAAFRTMAFTHERGRKSSASPHIVVMIDAVDQKAAEF